MDCEEESKADTICNSDITNDDSNSTCTDEKGETSTSRDYIGEGASCSYSTAKRARLEPYCIIHCSDDSTDLVSPVNVDSWKTLANAAKIRNHQPLLDIAENAGESIPSIYYHRECRMLFTMKRDLDKIEAANKNTNISKESRKSIRHQSNETASSRVYEEICLFCQKKTKYKKGQKTRDALIKCIDLRADDTVRTTAIAKGDKRIIAAVSRDLVAAEGHYHRVCYREYTRRDSHDHEEESGMSDEYSIAECKAYEMLFDFIRTYLFENPAVLKMTDLTDMLTMFMESLGVKDVTRSTRTHVRRKLESEFMNLLRTVPDDQGKLLIYPDTLTREQLVLENHKLRTELNELRENADSDRSIMTAALCIRTDIQNQTTQMSWPPSPSELRQDATLVPESVKEFLHILLTGIIAEENEPISDRSQRLLASFSQDLVHAVSNGKKKMPKHVLLPMAVKTLTGNVQLIKMINRLGHGLSYSQCEELETALCLKKLANTHEGTIPLPEHIQPYVFTTLAWDNIDRLEETLSGEGTSHRVNGIAIQPKVFGPVCSSAVTQCDETNLKKTRSIEAKGTYLPVYNAGERAGPLPRQYIDVRNNKMETAARSQDMLWMLCRLHSAANQTISSWTGFNIRVRNESQVVQDTVGYLPTINAPATNMSTVHEVLVQSLTIMESLHQKAIVVVFDQALYAKAAESVWKHRAKFQSIIIRLGVFHTICTSLGIIGKRFEDAGLKDVCIESRVIAEGSVGGVLNGHKYNRAVRFHKLMYEALLCLAWKGFIPWVEEKHPEQMYHIEPMMECVSDICTDTCHDTYGKAMEHSSYPVFVDLTERYLDYLRNDFGNLLSFWMSYIDMVETMLHMLRATSEGNWTLHLSAVRAIIPWCFAYNNLNYARYLSAYVSEMSHLPADHPEVYEHFKAGRFSVQLGSNTPFGRIPVDQTIEETINKDTQTPGGTKGFSLKPATISKYYLTAEYRSLYLGQLKRMSGLSNSDYNHADLQQPRIDRDERDVSRLQDLLENNWIDPFKEEMDDIVSLSTGKVAPADVASDLMKAHTIGEKAYETFGKERLESEPPIHKFNDKLSKQNVKTFTNININKTKKTCKSTGQEMILRADRNLFAHMILIAQRRNLHMKDVLAHPLGPIPWALATDHGLLRKTSKSVLAKEIKKSASLVESIPGPTASLIDGMSLVQKVKGDHKTFSEIADCLLASILYEYPSSERIDVVFDVYRDQSIKNAERDLRSTTDGTQYKNIAAGHSVQQWRRFLSNSTNKNSLIAFLVTEWKEEKYRRKLNNRILFVTCGENCIKITHDNSVEAQELCSTQEEADTRLMFHAANIAISGYQSIVMSCDDTDVLVLCLAFNRQIPCSIFMKCGVKARTEYVDISKIAMSIGENVCQSLIGMHAFTGCDTVSAFAGRGKCGAYKLVKKNKTVQKAFCHLGDLWNVPDELFEEIQKLTCLLYDSKTTTTTVNELRHCLFCSKKGEIESHQLPPCADTLYKHTMRANYQAGIWKGCLDACPSIPHPIGNGWCKGLEASKLSIEWCDGAAAPDAVLELLSCKCKRKCSLPKCTCMANGIVCTDLCNLKECDNQALESDIEDESYSSSNDDENEDSDS